MKAIVTGGSGFIGSHVVDMLLGAGHEVVIYDLEGPRHGQPCQYMRGDTRDVERLSQTARGVDVIYHLAAEANVNRFFDSPLFSNDITAQATACVLEASRRTGTPRVILASTEWIYGSLAEEGDEQITEETPYSQYPDHFYTASKIAAELACKTYNRLYQVPFTIMRFGIPFGERARPETVTPIFLRKILAGDTITIHGDGSQTRQFINVKDLAAGNAACIQEAAVNEIFNLNGIEKDQRSADRADARGDPRHEGKHHVCCGQSRQFQGTLHFVGQSRPPPGLENPSELPGSDETVCGVVPCTRSEKAMI